MFYVYERKLSLKHRGWKIVYSSVNGNEAANFLRLSVEYPTGHPQEDAAEFKMLYKHK